MQAMKHMEPQVKQAMKSFPVGVSTGLTNYLVSFTVVPTFTVCNMKLPLVFLYTFQAFGSPYYKGGFGALCRDKWT